MQYEIGFHVQKQDPAYAKTAALIVMRGLCRVLRSEMPCPQQEELPVLTRHFFDNIEDGWVSADEQGESHSFLCCPIHNELHP